MSLFTTGLTSVTFREKSAQEIVSLARECGLDGIEWGGDIHVPHGDCETADAVARMTLEAGLKVLSYGSYYRVGPLSEPRRDFAPVLRSAAALHAPRIRVWAGEQGSAQSDDAFYEKTAANLREITRMAMEEGIGVSLEYHRRTLTDCSGSALRLLRVAVTEGLATYWQPNPDLSFAENRKELADILPFLSAVHVFQWTVNDIRHPLEEGTEVWQSYLDILRKAGRDVPLILEFVVGDDADCFRADALTLRGLAGGR